MVNIRHNAQLKGDIRDKMDGLNATETNRDEVNSLEIKCRIICI